MRTILITTLLCSMSATAAAQDAPIVVERPREAQTADWNLTGGLMPPQLLQTEVGFSMVSVAYHHRLKKQLAAGGMVAFDFAHWTPDDAFGASLVFGAPLTISMFDRDEIVIGARFTPGLYLGIGQNRFSQVIPGFWMEFAANVGFRLDERFIVGGGIDIPLLVGIPTGGRDAFVAVPILFGPTAELHVGPDWAFTADLKMGPHVMSDDFFGTRFGIRVLVGLSYRL